MCDMEKVVVKKVKSNKLSEFLRGMEIGQEVTIRDKEFRIMSVYGACFRLKKEGYSFKCSARKEIDGCRVTRIG